MQGQMTFERPLDTRYIDTSGIPSPIAEGLVCVQALQLPQRSHALLQPPEGNCLGLLILCTCIHIRGMLLCSCSSIVSRRCLNDAKLPLLCQRVCPNAWLALGREVKELPLSSKTPKCRTLHAR